eukprot:scaffold16219_cov65-Phaeocystis_antarctica.AAC.9
MCEGPNPLDTGRLAFTTQAEGWSVAFLVEVDDTQTVNFELVYDWGAWCCAPQPTTDARPVRSS